MKQILPLIALTLLSGCSLLRPNRPTLEVQVTTSVALMIEELTRPQGYMPLVSWSDTLVLTRELGDRSGRIYPMLFFGPGESEIPERYQQLDGPEEALEYQTWQVVEYSFLRTGWSHEKQEEVLDVLGKWLRDADDSHLSLQGGFSSEEGESEKIADQRARAVQDYLTRVWEVDQTRIQVLPSRHLARPSDHVLAQQEARTVRIFPSATNFLRNISFNTTRHPGFVPVGLKLTLDESGKEDWGRASLTIVSRDDTLTRTSLPLPQPPPEYIVRDPEEYLVEEYALWTLPRDVRFLGDSLLISATLMRVDGSTVQTDEVPIALSVMEEGKHREFTDEYEILMMADMTSEFPEHQNEFHQWLGEGVLPSRAITFTLNSFSFHDGVLSPTHMALVDRYVERLRREIATDTSRRWRMKVVGSVDAIEWEGVSHADIDRIARSMSVTTALAEGRIVDGGIRPNLYFPSGAHDKTGSGAEEEYREIVRIMFDGRDWGLEESGLRGMGMSWVHPYDTISLHPRTYPQKSGTRRAAEVADQLESLLDDLSFDSVTHDANNSTPLLTLETPENRIHDREVTITFYNDRSYQWFLDETGREWGRVQVR